MKRNLLILFLLLFWLGTNAQTGKYVETNGVKIYYETYGSGEPLLLLHGFLLSHQIWEPWIERLSSNYQLIVPDLRGHGRSTNPSNVYTHKLVAKDILGLMDELGIKHVKAIGHSGGAATLIHMATMDSSRITAMILVGGSLSYYTEETRSRARSMSFETLGAGFKSLVESLQPGGEEQIRRLITHFNNMADSYDDINFTPPYLSTIKSQTLIIQGDRDPFFPVDYPVNSFMVIPNSYLWIVPNSGHDPFGFMGEESIWSDVALKVFNEFLQGKWE